MALPHRRILPTVLRGFGAWLYSLMSLMLIHWSSLANPSPWNRLLAEETRNFRSLYGDDLEHALMEDRSSLAIHLVDGRLLPQLGVFVFQKAQLRVGSESS